MLGSSIIEGASALIIPAWDGQAIALQIIKFDGRDAGFAHGSNVQRPADYMAGRRAARQALDSLGLGHCEVGSGNCREPLWPTGVIGSISHNHEFAGAVAVYQADNRGIGIGIDIEAVTAVDVEDMLDAAVISAQESDYLRELKTTWSPATLACLIFSAKESFFKASFPTVGKYFDFEAITLQRLDPVTGTISFLIQVPLAKQLPAGAIRIVHFKFFNPTTILTSCNLPPVD